MFLLIATWHIYDSILSPDVFPLNKSIFTGYMSKKQMQNLHPLQLHKQSENGKEAAEKITA